MSEVKKTKAKSKKSDPSGDLPEQSGISQKSRDDLREHVDHICHMLSEQGPMSVTFVHNNTLLGLQKMHFEEAIIKAQGFIGGRGYLENSEHRAHYQSGRINDGDLTAVMARRKDLKLGKTLAKPNKKSVDSDTVLKLHLIHGINALDESDLRQAIAENSANRKFLPGLPVDVKNRILQNSNVQFESAIGEIGASLTLSQWLEELLNIDLVDYIRRDATQAVAEQRELSGTATDRLREMQIPQEKWDDYSALVGKLIGKNATGANTETAIGYWLATEKQLVEKLSRKYFDIDGDFSSLKGYFSENTEEYAVLGMWSASLGQFGVADPFSSIDHKNIQENDVWSDASERLAEQAQNIEMWGGPPVKLSTSLRKEISSLVNDELSALGNSESPDALARAHLCWNILHDLADNHINRPGFKALQTLLSLPDNGGKSSILGKIKTLDPRRNMGDYVNENVAADIASLTSGKSHIDLIQSLCGEKLVERINDYMIGLCSAFLDEGLAAWHLPGRALGFYDSWRNLSVHDRSFDFDGLNGWREDVQSLPILPVDAVITQLKAIGIPEHDWPDYCGRLLVDLKGWAGMIFWRQLNSDYSKQQAHPIDVMQYLAVRLFYQNLLVEKACQDNWQIRSGIDDLRQYFNSHQSEYLVRKMLYGGKLPDHIAEQAVKLVDEQSFSGHYEADRWDHLADISWIYHESQETVRQAGDRGWRLFTLSQRLGFDSKTIRSLSKKHVNNLIGCIDDFPENQHGPIWLHAFEHHYLNEILNAMALNRGRGRWMKRNKRPKSQVVFCIDEREESIHRHYEELDPEHETMGAAGFFGVAMDYTGLDEHHHTPLCPAPVTPLHSVHEVARPVDEKLKLPAHRRQSKWLEVFHDTFWEMKRNVVGSYFLIDIAGFLAAYPLLGRIFFPVRYFKTAKMFRDMFVPTVKTQVTVDSVEGGTGADHGHGAVALGFTLEEQADRVEGLLRNIGLIKNFAPIVVFCAHGSHSENNPHENAHDCGACGGKHGAPNSRVVAAMANSPNVRKILHKRGIIIPKDTWFVGATHNTANDIIDYFDEEDVPAEMMPKYQEIVADLQQATMRAARERCRRFASAPKDVSIEASFQHTQNRAYDFSQVRPEWGHATNAFAVVGRRGITQGVFFDRRPFVISYDPSTDPTGVICERILLAVGPVGAGINLEYYFSTVDPQVFGSDTKVPHNVTGLIGVMEGAYSDLRTGLPRQMTEVHEAMRLHLIVDAPMAILGEIYGRQPGIQELLDGEWVILIAHDPETGEFNRFVPGVGFEKWDDSQLEEIPEVSDSYAWFKGKYERFLPPALITEPNRSWIS